MGDEVKVLVTGALGYIGPVLTRVLRAHGNLVDGLDVGFFLPFYAEPPVYPTRHRFEDIRTPVVLDDYDVIVHLAGLSNDPLGNLHPNLTHRINYEGTVRLLRNYPMARHVVFSSCSVYGANEMATEGTLTNPLTPYAKAKADVDAWAIGKRNILSLRLGTVYGYSPGHRTDLVVNSMVYDAVNGRPIRVNGNASRPLVHVEDVARAVLWGIANERSGVVNVVGENWRIRDLAEHISAFTGGDILYLDGGADQRDYMADGSLLRSQGWWPKHTVEGSLPVLAERTINLPNKDYTRLGAIQSLVASGNLTTYLTPKELVAA